MSTRTTGSFTFADWDERPLGPAEARPGLALASVANTFTGGIQATATTCAYITANVTEKTGTFVGFELVTGSLDGREGAFVIEQRGSFDEEYTVRCAFEVVAGSGTGALTGLSGTGHYTAVHGEPATAYTFDYDLD